MANEKKTIKTKLVQVGSEKIDMPFSLSELILDSTSGKTVKEQIADLQPKTDDSLTTDDKTVVGAINELDTKVGDIKIEIGKKKVPGTPEVVEEYVACLQTDDGALEVVADGSVTDNNTQIELTTANSLGGSFSIGEYVKHVPHMDAVPEVPGTGMYKFVEDSINQALVGGEVDLSGYQEKVDNNLTTDDKNLVNVINALADNSHIHEAFTDAEIEQMFTDLTPEEVQMYQNLIDDNSVSTNRIYSSSKVKDLITEALLQSQQYADNLVGAMNSMTAKVVPQLPDTGQELVLYLVGDSSSGYTMHMYIEGAFVELGSMDIDLTDYVKTDDMNTALTDKADDDKVIHVDNIKTTLSDVPSNANVLSELAVKNLLDEKADTTSLPTKTSELTNDSGFLTEHQDLSDYAKTTDLPAIATVINASSTNDDVAGALSVQNKISEIIDVNYLVDANYPTSQFCYTNGSTLNTPYKEGLTSAQNEFIISAKKNQDTWNSQICMDIGNSTLFYRYATDSNNKWSKWTQIQTNYLQRNSRLINIPGWKRNITITFTNTSGASALIFTQYGSIIPVNTAGSKVYVMDFGNAIAPSGSNISWGLDADNQMKVTINSSIGNMIGSIIINNDPNATVEYGTENNPQANVMKNPNYVADVPVTKITWSDETYFKSNAIASTENYFQVRNGVCYVNIDVQCVVSKSGGYTLPITLPKPATGYVHAGISSLPGSTGEHSSITIAIANSGNSVVIYGGITNNRYLGIFSYPVAEN